MDIKLTKRLNNLMNAELAKRLLIRYFDAKQANFTQPLNPQSMADIGQSIPEFYQKVEIVPYVSKLDPLTGFTEIGWNLFVLGNQRMYLGRTKHKSLGELVGLRDAVAMQDNMSDIITTPKQVIEFICKTLKHSDDGKLEMAPPTELPRFMRRPTITAPYASYYEKRRWGR